MSKGFDSTVTIKAFEIHIKLRLKCENRIRLFCGQFTSMPTKPELRDGEFQKN